MTTTPEMGELLTTGEVAQLFRVDPKTVTRWANARRIGSVRTVGGHRRFYKAEVTARLEASRVRVDRDHADMSSAEADR